MALQVTGATGTACQHASNASTPAPAIRIHTIRLPAHHLVRASRVLAVNNPCQCRSGGCTWLPTTCRQQSPRPAAAPEPSTMCQNLLQKPCSAAVRCKQAPPNSPSCTAGPGMAVHTGFLRAKQHLGALRQGSPPRLAALHHHPLPAGSTKCSGPGEAGRCPATRKGLVASDVCNQEEVATKGCSSKCCQPATGCLLAYCLHSHHGCTAH
jgi:hypothetical protein